MKKTILALAIATVSAGVFANTYDAGKTNYSTNTIQNPDAMAHAQAMTGTTGYARSKVYASDATAYGDDRTYAGYRATAIGSNTVANGEGAVAFGHSATASGVVSIAHGNGAKANGNGATVLGANAKASVQGAVALGYGSEATNQALWNRTNDSAVVDILVIHGWAGTKSMGEVSVGSAGNERAISNVAAGEVSQTSTEAVNGSQLYSVVKEVADNNYNIGLHKVDIDDHENRLAKNESKLYSISNQLIENKDDIALSSLRLDGHDTELTTHEIKLYAHDEQLANHKDRITNNEARLNSAEQIQTAHNALIRDNTQAISANTRLINRINGSVTTNTVGIAQNREKIAINRANINKLSIGLADTNKRIDRITGDVAKNRKRASAGTASAFAVANIPHATHGGYSALGIGVGGHAGQQAIAVRYSKMTENTKWIMSTSVAANTQDEVSWGAGLTRQW